MSPWRRAGIALGAAGAVAGAVATANRVAARRLRARGDGEDVLGAHWDRTWRIPAHDGGEIHVVEAGSGPPILLSHGVTLSLRTWARQLDGLAAAGFRVVAFDHRGHGESKLGSTGHGVEQLAHDMRSVLEGLDLRDAVIVGHSMGGIATQSFCIRHPALARERVAGIVLLSTLARSPFAANPRVAHLMTRLAHRLPDTAGVLRARDLGLMLARIGFGRNADPAHVEATRQMILATSPATRRDATVALAGLDLSARLGEIDRPTLVICGTADVITPLAESRRIARRIPGARLEIVEGGGHMLMLERAEIVDALISDFAREVQRPGLRPAAPHTGS
ncbi:MAG: alpha/beta fold hydrolase [Acidimicrobiia bacterium]